MFFSFGNIDLKPVGVGPQLHVEIEILLPEKLNCTEGQY